MGDEPGEKWRESIYPNPSYINEHYKKMVKFLLSFTEGPDYIGKFVISERFDRW